MNNQAILEWKEPGHLGCYYCFKRSVQQRVTRILTLLLSRFVIVCIITFLVVVLPGQNLPSVFNFFLFTFIPSLLWTVLFILLSLKKGVIRFYNDGLYETSTGRKVSYNQIQSFCIGEVQKKALTIQVLFMNYKVQGKNSVRAVEIPHEANQKEIKNIFSSQNIPEENELKDTTEIKKGIFR